ncbi:MULTISPECIES: DNA-binding transcriptional regulator [unclassified Lentimonas]|uniref:AraC family transcriptional regulator n=1 Tax=unclassified Lentimonas TaxID=2630993 RepID=UPI0013206C47|nr:MULTISPECIES: DNA-binding transcriptional regulator [unclassified Lentimonas]CAA6692420.1 Unannotated [Lentimonas sp. CC19]CAA6694018.1 Unannotated [Lentimonas sp. CC10]CAA7072238.1 Unannotated [Lentimonas sp. CC11]
MNQKKCSVTGEYHSVPQVAILVDTATGWGRRVVRGILSYAEKVGPWHVWIRPSGRGDLEELPDSWNGDGIIARISSHEIARFVQQKNIPVVNVSGITVDGFEAPCVTTDYEKVATTAVEHFLDRGFRNFGYVGPVYESFVSRHHHAFEDALSALGHPCVTYPMAKLGPDTDIQTIRRTLRQWVASLPRPIGVFSWGATVGRDVIEACLWEKISVPYDVAVLGGDFDDLLNVASYPALSGVVTPAEQIGYQAAEKLHKTILGESVENETTLLPPVGVEERLSTDVIAVDDPKLAQVVAYIREHAFEQIVVDDILKAVPMSRRILERRFQQAFGRTLLAEIRRVRINRARKLLSETDMQMQDIAEACGYNTYNYLTHIFKRVAGMTPTDYRKQWRINR